MTTPVFHSTTHWALLTCAFPMGLSEERPTASVRAARSCAAGEGTWLLHQALTPSQENSKKSRHGAGREPPHSPESTISHSQAVTADTGGFSGFKRTTGLPAEGTGHIQRLTMVKRAAEKLPRTAAHCRHTWEDTTFRVNSGHGAAGVCKPALLEDTSKDLAAWVRTTLQPSLTGDCSLPLTQSSF